MFSDLKINKEINIWSQIKVYIKNMILNGMFYANQKLPSTRELSEILNVGRNTVIRAYEELQDEGFIYFVKGSGAYVSNVKIYKQKDFIIDWEERLSYIAHVSDELDITKHEPTFKKGMISFRSIAPENNLFDLESFKRAFLDILSNEGENMLNYGYSKGFKPLIEYLLDYMKNKGAEIDGKDIIITNGFTEGFDLVLSCITDANDTIICENPTHNTAIKIMKLHKLDICGVDMEDDGINIDMLKNTLSKNKPKLAYLTPSYHNPTGTVMSPEKRLEVFNIFKENGIPVIEDGFNEELRYSGAHISPIVSLGKDSNGIIYIGSLSKILFPGLRIGWIFADKKLISYLESIKRSRNIHTSVLDQGIFYQFLIEGNFEKSIKKARKYYKGKYEFALSCAKKYIPSSKIIGEGGLHIFIKMETLLDARLVLNECIKQGVIFTPGDIFHTDGLGQNSFRLGISRVSLENIEKGFKIIGEVIYSMNKQ